MPDAPALDKLDISTAVPALLPPLEGFTFEGYRNRDGSVGTKNILGITTSVQCVTGTLEYAVKRIRAELLPKYPNVDDVIPVTHAYGCGVAISAPDAVVPIRTLQNIALNPNFGGEVMVVELGCEKLSPERLVPEGVGDASCGCRTKPSTVSARSSTRIMTMADARLAVLNRAPPRDLPRVRSRHRPAMRRQRRIFRRHRQSGRRLCLRPSGACGRDRDVLRSHGSTRRHPAARRAAR